MAKIRLKVGHWYRIKDRGITYNAQYVGRQEGFECCICGKGNNAYTFNLWYDANGDYETWGFGKEHMPEILEELGGIDDMFLTGEGC